MCGFVRTAVISLGVVSFALAGSSVGTAASAAGGAAKPEAVKPKPKPSPVATKIRLTEELVLQMAKASGSTSDVVRATVQYVNNYKPREARQLEALLKESPAKFRTTFRQANYELRNLEALKESSPVIYKRRTQILALQAKADVLVDRYKEASEAEKPQVEVELTKVLGQIFDLRILDEQYQLDQLRKQVEQTAERIRERTENKDRIVDRQVTRVLGIDEVLVW